MGKKIDFTVSGDALDSVEKIKCLLKDAESNTDVLSFAISFLEMCLFKKVHLVDKNGNCENVEYFWTV